MSVHAKGVFFVVIFVGAYSIASSMDYADALEADAMLKERAARNIMLSLPLDCDAWVLQSGPGIKRPKARCYMRPSRK